MKNILIIGSGGREHALAWKLSQDKKVREVYCMPGNGGTRKVAINVNHDINDFEEIYNYVIKNKIDMVIVGPEAPLDRGIVDFFNNKKIKIFGPTQFASQLECSKLFARKFMHQNNIPQPKYYECSNIDSSYKIKEELGLPLVLKADGLAAGKGVLICNSDSEFEDGVKAMFTDKRFGLASSKISIEECLIGEELSVFAVCDGKNFKIIGDAQDHKRIFDNDQGPNTGGMGAYSPTRICTDKILYKVENEIIKPTLKGMNELGHPFKGFLYIGLMIVDGELFVIEFNVRMGDPETQVVIPRIKASLYDIFKNCIEGTINDMEIGFDPKTFITVVLASEGYPDKYKIGQTIELSNYDGLLFHAGTKYIDEKHTVSGGRVLSVVGCGKDLEEAISQTYKTIDKISFSGLYYRTDIGKKGL